MKEYLHVDISVTYLPFSTFNDSQVRFHFKLLYFKAEVLDLFDT